MTLVLKINYLRFAEKNETDDFVQNNMSECLFTILTNVFFSFLYRDELVCSHLDGIFVKKKISHFNLWPLCCCFFTSFSIIRLGCLNPDKDVIKPFVQASRSFSLLSTPACN